MKNFINVAALTSLCLTVNVLVSCNSDGGREHKWMFYDMTKENAPVYQGYSTTHTPAQHVELLNDIKARQSPPQLVTLDKPTINEANQLHFVFYYDHYSPPDVSCKFTEHDYIASHDTKLVPEFLKKSALVSAQNSLAQSEKEAAKANQEALGFLSMAGTFGEKGLTEKAVNALKEASQRIQKTQEHVKEAKEQLLLAQEQIETEEIKAIVCDFDGREKGSKRVDYELLFRQDQATEKSLIKDSVFVHELYSFRILAGPVFTTLQKRNKHYSLKQKASGTNEVSATAAQDSPANFVLMLKAYHTKRDVLDPPRLFSNRWREAINPVIGINLLDKPLQNFYGGLSVEVWPGFDVIGGAHWAKTEQLTAGFSQGQTTDRAIVTKERFNNGWFVGTAVDIGIVTSWLGKIASGVPEAFKPKP